MQRTVKGTLVQGLKVNEKGQAEVVEVVLTKRYTDREKVLKALFKAGENIAVISFAPCSRLYKLDDSVFFKYAKFIRDVEEGESIDEDADEGDIFEAEEV